jgi:hypothetical protein
MQRVRRLVLLSLLPCGCSSPSATPPDGSGPREASAPEGQVPREQGLLDRPATADGPARGDLARDHGTSDGGKPDGPTPMGLPFPYTRPQVGAPVSASELAAATDSYVDLLRQTRYLAVLDERLHGWPQSDPQQRYWYGTWWGGVGIQKQAGKVTYLHGKAGGNNNNGLRTGPMLEGICHAVALWGKPELEALARRMTRGFSSWILAMQQQPNDPNGTLLTRASYPPSIDSSDGGRSLKIDYDLSRPGDDGAASEYVHVPMNPHWGDLWVKNKRSKDDIGHMLRAIAALSHCQKSYASADSKLDHAEMLAHYVKWAKRVEDDGWAIATLDKSGKLWIPPLTETLAHFYTVGNVECDSVLAIRLLGRNDPGSWNCGTGIHALEFIALQNDHNGEIIRSFHEAATILALQNGQHAAAKLLLTGLAARIDEAMGWYETNQWPIHMEEKHLADLLAISASMGVPLTNREVRFLHAMIGKAHTSYVKNASPKSYRVFDAATPDGAYAFEPGGEGLRWVSLALLVGTCSAQYLNPTSTPALDCAKLKASFPTPVP